MGAAVTGAPKGAPIIGAATVAPSAGAPTKPPCRTSGMPSRLRSAPMTVAAPKGAAMVVMVGAAMIGAGMIGAAITGAAITGAATCVTTGAAGMIVSILSTVWI